MGLKEKLESLSNTQIHTLWDVWIDQNAELPDEKQMIDELLEIAVCDSGHTESELLSDIENIGVMSKTIKGNIKLLAGLQESYNEYCKDILPLHPDNTGNDNYNDDYEAYDTAKNEFLESLWDVIQQHFDDLKSK